MAKIRGMQEQQKALERVQFCLKELKNMQDFLDTDNPSNQYELNFKRSSANDEPDDETAGKRKKVSVKFKLMERDTLQLVFSEYRDSLIKEIRSLTEEYRIDLEQDEEKLLH